MDTGLFLEIFPDFLLDFMGLMRRMGPMGLMRKGGGKRAWGLFAIFSDSLLDFMGLLSKKREGRKRV